MDLDRLVTENRFTISVLFPVIGAVMLIASAEKLLPGLLSFNPYLIMMGTLVMRLPLIAGLQPLADRKLLLGLSVLTVYSFVIEFVGTTTGFPYGEFSYLIELGPMIGGKIPLGLPIFFIPLVVNSYLLVMLTFPEWSRKLLPRLLMVIATVLLLDLVLDPGAVAIGFWSYKSGFYYGVPLSNYFGWVLSASISVAILDISFDRSRIQERLEKCDFMLDDMVSFIFLWGLVNLYFQQAIPFLISIILGIALARTERFEFVLDRPGKLLINKFFRRKIY